MSDLTTGLVTGALYRFKKDASTYIKQLAEGYKSCEDSAIKELMHTRSMVSPCVTVAKERMLVVLSQIWTLRCACSVL